MAIALVASGAELLISYENALQKASVQTQTTSYLVSEWLTAAFTTPQYVLKDIVSSIDTAEIKYPADNPAQQLERTNRLIHQAKLHEPIHFLGIFDRNCTITHTSIGVNLGLNFKQREYCELIFQEPIDAFKVSNMFRSITNQMNLSLAYPVLTPSRHIAGFALVGLDLSLFQRWLDKFDLSQGATVSVFDAKQQLLARQPVVPEMIGQPVDNPTLRQLISSPDVIAQTINMNSPIDGINRVSTFRRVENSPFVVVAGITTESVLSAWWVKLTFYVVGNAILLGAIAFGARELNHNRKLAKAMHAIAHTDELTKVANRRQFVEILQFRVAEANRHQQTFSIVLIDIDHFKQINDNYGHDMGDRVLQTFAQILQRELRANDNLARWGGEEFIALLSQTDGPMAIKIGEHMLAAVATIAVSPVPSRDDIRLTASIGISQYRPNEAMDAVIKRADEALYSAKHKGRNRLESFL